MMMGGIWHPSHTLFPQRKKKKRYERRFPVLKEAENIATFAYRSNILPQFFFHFEHDDIIRKIYFSK